MSTSNAGQWVVFDYEVDMFRQTQNLCQSAEFNSLSPPIPNAVVESMLLHLRILVDILLSRGTSPDGDDIKLNGLLPGFTSPLIEQLRTRYGNRTTAGCPCWTLNKMLAHPSTLRGESYSYAKTVETTVPVMRSLIDEIAAARLVG